MIFSTRLEQFDPALLAFVKCHVTSPLKWETLRVLAAHDGAWIGAEQLARATHKRPAELRAALADLLAEGVVEESSATSTGDVSYRLPRAEPTTVVLRRLIEAATHSQELRAIIAAYLQRSRRPGDVLPGQAASPAAI
ncbi:MAG: hypothetical protein M3336_04255 [Chloroflexota bacterium]|nr:hypothetical protein [Chloroflexota bacterium]